MGRARVATIEDIELVGKVAAGAFEADPLMSWVFPDGATRLAMLRQLMTGLAGSYIPAGGLVHLVDDASTALWRDPAYDHHPPPPEPADEEQDEPSPSPFPADSVERLGILSAAMHAHHPHEPHWYLNVLGTMPTHQSEGLGALVLAPVLEVCDTEGVRAYLESSNPRNIPFYFRHGFVQSGEITLPDGPSLYPMWREPRG